MLEVIREVSREKDAEPRPVLRHMLNTGSADLFMESYKLKKKDEASKISSKDYNLMFEYFVLDIYSNASRSIFTGRNN